jgi:predicted metalloprotease
VLRRSLPALTLLVALALTAGACAKAAQDDPLSVSGDSGFDVDSHLGDSVDTPIRPGTGIGKQKAPTADQVVQAALTDVNSFWSRSFKGLYSKPYKPISGGYWPYGPDTEQPPCGKPGPSYSDIADNAFYCSTDDLVAWDDVNLVPGLYKEFGGFTLGIVFAHEFGHAIQQRAGVTGDTIMTELQADCFAGAWTQDVSKGHSTYFQLKLADLDKAIAGFLDLRDGNGTDAADPAAHGTGFDRIGAFTDGFQAGLQRCKAYPSMYADGELVIVEVPFTDQADFDRGGNLPLDEVVSLATEDLQQFWEVLFSEEGKTWTPVKAVTPVDPDADSITCGDQTYSGDVLVNASFYCVSDDTIYLDAVNLVPALYDIGDYAVATELARQFAYAAQVRLGDLDNTRETNLQADCFAGLYASSGFTGNRGDAQKLFLSPGDLDEAVIGFLATSDDASDTGSDKADTGAVSVGSAFDRFDAYRSGFLDGTTACDKIVAGKA